MLISLILAIILIIYLIIASISDIKTREVPDWLSYSIIPLAFLLRIIECIITQSLTILIYTAITFAIFVGISILLYYTRQWGGGDAKIFMAIGAALPLYPKIFLNYLHPTLNLPFPLILIMNILIMGALYGIISFIAIAIKNKIQIKLSKKVKLTTSIITFLLLILAIFSPNPTKVPVFLLAILMFIFPYMTKLSRIVQKKIFIKKISLSKLTEGDWIAKDIYKKKKLLLSHKIPGITNEQIQMLKNNNIKTVAVKYGIPFLPPFLLGVLLTLLIGNLFVI